MRSETVATFAAKCGRAVCQYVLIPLIEFIAALGGGMFFYTREISTTRLQGVLGVGISPASNLTGNLPQSTVIQYSKTFIENLKGMTPWVRCTTRRMLDEHSGNRLQLFMYQNLPAPPTTVAPEGTIGTGLTVSVVQNVSVMGQYGDYCNVSDAALGYAIDPTLEALGVQMSYRLAQVINTLLQNTADGANAVDPLVAALSKDATTPVVTTDITAATQSLAGVNALPMENGNYLGVISPLTIGDILSDKNNNSLVDVIKRHAEGYEQLRELFSADKDTVPIIDWGGVSFFQSTFVKTTPNYKGGTGTALRTYILGRDAVIGISFGAKDHTNIGDGDWRNLQVWIRRLTEPTGFDPARMIGGFSSYNAMYTCTLPPDTVMRMRYIDAVSTIPV